jgi:hypothetical protein
MDWTKFQETYAALSKGFELGKYVQPAYNLLPSNLPKFASYAPAWENLTNAFQKFEQFTRLAESFPTESEVEEWYENRKKSTLTMAQRGWFIPLQMTLGEFTTLFKKIAAQEEDEAEVLIEQYLEANLSEIEAELITEFPGREAILKEAFQLHRDGRYFGSIAVFLSLSDGIGYEIFQVSPLSSGKGKLERIQKLIEPHRTKDFLIGWCWDAIGQVLPVNDRTDNLGNYVDPLNRHAVLHGLRSDHGSRRNSLKALSWLNHVAQFRDMLLVQATTAAADA